MMLWGLVLVVLLGTGCGFRHCIEFERDDTKAALCEAQCRCVAPEKQDPTPLLPKYTHPPEKNP